MKAFDHFLADKTADNNTFTGLNTYFRVDLTGRYAIRLSDPVRIRAY